MKKLFRIIMVLLGCLHLAGGPHAMLQGVAWATMLVSYSKEGGVIQGAIDTFGGERPCQLCELISTSKGAEQETDSDPLSVPRSFSVKLFQDMIPPRIVVVRVPRAVDLPAVCFSPPGLYLGQGREAPPLPPPLVVA